MRMQLVSYVPWLVLDTMFKGGHTIPSVPGHHMSSGGWLIMIVYRSMNLSSLQR